MVKQLDGRAQVRDVSGVWKDLTENVNIMAGDLTAQVRNIADVTIAVANGDLSKKITVDVRGEILQLKEANNNLNIISGYATLIRASTDGNPKTAENVGVIIENVERGVALVQQLLAMARKAETKFEQVKVSGVALGEERNKYTVGEGETILFVDDEAHQLRLMQIHLQRSGYRVLTASDDRSRRETPRPSPPCRRR